MDDLEARLSALRVTLNGVALPISVSVDGADLAALLRLARAVEKLKAIEDAFNAMSPDEWDDYDGEEHWKQQTDTQTAIFAALDALEGEGDE